MKPIFQYSDYRAYLRDYYAHQKKELPHFSYAYFAKKANLGSANYLQMIMQGRRQLTPATIQSFAKAIPLLGDELNYFESLVHANQGETVAEQRFYSRRVKEYKLKLRSLSPSPSTRVSQTQLIHNSLHAAVALILSRRTVEKGIGAAAKALGLTERKIQEVIQQLLRTENLRVIEGKYALPALHTMMSDPKGHQKSQREWIKYGLDENLTMFQERYPSGHAKFLSLLCTAPAGSLNELFYELRTSAEASVKKHDPLPDQETGVYRVQVQVYRSHQNES